MVSLRTTQTATIRYCPMLCRCTIIRSFISLTAFVAFMGGLRSQDVQFSQFYANPLYLNPALAGSHSGTYRIMSSYRNQWAGVVDRPFTTFSAGGDLKFTLRNERGSYSGGNDRVAAGVQFFSDRIGIYDYNTNRISFFGAYHKLLNGANKTYLSAGLQFGFAQRGINYEDLTFQDQFNGVDGFGGATAEPRPANALGYGDMSIGINFATAPKKDKGFHLGIGYQHFNKPNISFFNTDNRFTEEYEAFTLEPKLTIHTGVSVVRSELLSVQPRAIYVGQGSAASLIIGTNLKYNFIQSDDASFHIGGWLRASDNISTFQPTDLIVSVGFQQRGMLLGFSYDHHFRDLGASLLGQGIFEFTVSYIGEHENEDRLCPEF